MAEENQSILSTLELIARAVTEGNNILREIKAESPKSAPVETFDKFKDHLKSLGISISQRGKGGRFVSNENAVKNLYKSLAKEQTSAMKQFSSALKLFSKDFAKTVRDSIKDVSPAISAKSPTRMQKDWMESSKGPFNRRLGYVANLRTGQDALLPRMLRDSRASVLRMVDFASGGRSPRELDRLTNKNLIENFKKYRADKRKKLIASGEYTGKEGRARLRNFDAYTQNAVDLMAKRAGYLSKVRRVGDAVSGRGVGVAFNSLLRGKSGAVAALGGSLIKFLGANAIIGIGLEIGKSIYDAFERGRDAFKRVSQIQAQGGYSGPGRTKAENVKEFIGASYAATALGLSREEWEQRALKYTNMGMTYREALQGAEVEKGFGLGDVSQSMLMYSRRTDAAARFSGDLTKAFQSLKGLVGTTGLSMAELDKGISTVVGSMKGQFSMSGVTDMLGRFGEFVRSGQTDWGTVSSLYNKNQTSDFTQMALLANLLDSAGWKWDNPNTDISGKVYELRGYEPERMYKAGRAATKQQYLQYAGTTNLSKIDASTKSIINEFLSNILGTRTGFERLPKNEALIQRYLEGGKLDEKTQESIKKSLAGGSAKEVAQSINQIYHPVTQMRDFMMSKYLTKSEQEGLIKSFRTSHKSFTELKAPVANVSVQLNPDGSSTVTSVPGDLVSLGTMEK